MPLSGILIDDNESSAIVSLDRSSDRAAAIIAATIIEARLRACLERRFERNEAIEKEMFRTTGPLGSFSAKIKLAFLMRIISIHAYHDLDTIKNIRNRFAHYLDVNDFDSQRIKSWCQNLTLIEKHFQEMVGAGKELPNPHGVSFVMAIENRDAKLGEPKWRYLMTAMLFSTAMLLLPPNRPAL